MFQEIIKNSRKKVFGARKKPEYFPKWVKYTRSANREQLNEIYNSSAIFICSSVKEGFGLTCVESMACGCALAVTDFLGSREYAVNNVNASVSPCEDVEAMYRNVCRLISDPDLRRSIALKGVETARQMSWDNAVPKFEAALYGTA